MVFDVRFTEDDHFFHHRYLTEQRADDDAAELLGLLGLEPGSAVLDAGCGDGRIATRLSSVGYLVTGIDLDPEQLRRAASRGPQRGAAVTWRLGDLADLDEVAVYDGAFLWFNTLGFADDESTRRILAAVARSLRPGAPLVIDTLSREAVRAALAAESGPVTLERDAATQRDESRFDEGTGRLITTRTVTTASGVIRRTLSLRLPTLEEWAQLLALCGLGLESATSRAGGPLDDENLELVLVARRGAAQPA